MLRSVVQVPVCLHFLVLSTLGANPKLLDEFELCNDDTLVFVGDSISHQCLYTQYVEDFIFGRQTDTNHPNNV